MRSRHGGLQSPAIDRLLELAEQLGALATEISEQVEIAPASGTLDWDMSHEQRALLAARVARALVDTRHFRTRFFDADLFGEPTWDMLLDLFISRIDAKCISVSSLAVASGTPHATALRHMAKLEQAGLVRRTPDPHDSRRVNIALSDEAADSIIEIMLRFSRRATALSAPFRSTVEGTEDWATVSRN